MAERKLLRVHGAIAREIGIAIVSGRLRPGHVLESEPYASVHRQVSRTAYREATRLLTAKGLIQSRPRTGTRVSPMSEWHLLDPDVMAWLFSNEPAAEMLDSLFDLRAIVEPPAAALAALRRRPVHLARMRQALDDLQRYDLQRPEGRRAEMEFHAEMLAATCSPLVTSLTNAVTAAVSTRLPKTTRDPMTGRLRIFEAVRAQEPEAARAAMEDLLRFDIQHVIENHRSMSAAPPGEPRPSSLAE